MAHTIEDVKYDHGHDIYVDDPDTYHVDKILKCRTRRSKIQYLVKWTGYSNNANSWVSEDDVTSDLKNLFSEQRKDAKRTSAMKRKRAPSKKRSKKARRYLPSPAESEDKVVPKSPVEVQINDNLGSFMTTSMEDAPMSEKNSLQDWSLRYDTSADSDKSKRSELQKSKELFNEN